MNLNSQALEFPGLTLMSFKYSWNSIYYHILNNIIIENINFNYINQSYINSSFSHLNMINLSIMENFLDDKSTLKPL